MRNSKQLLRATQGALRSAGQRYEYRQPDFEVDHLVVGGGVIGLACAARLTTELPDKTTYLVERHNKVSSSLTGTLIDALKACAHVLCRSDKRQGRYVHRKIDII